MKPLVIIGCGSVKSLSRCSAAVMYQGPLFKAKLAYARLLTDETQIRILSAKHGFLKLETEIEPYDVTWGDEDAIGYCTLMDQIYAMRDEFLQPKRPIIILAGKSYALLLMAGIDAVLLRYLSKTDFNFQLPLKGLAIGKQIQWLKSQL